MLTRIILVVGVFLTLGSSDSFARGRVIVRGNSCGVGVCHNVAVKEVITPVAAVAVPVFVPTFQYQYVPPPCVPVVAANPPVVNLNSPTYGMNSEKERIKEIVRAVLLEMNRPSGADDGPPMALGDFGTSSPSLHERAVLILQNRCASCHTGQSSKHGFAIFDDGGNFNPLIDRTQIVQKVDANLMPPRARVDLNSRLTEAEKQILRDWSK